MRSRSPTYLALLALLPALACGEPAGLGGEDVDIRTDLTTYKLQYTPGLFWVEMSVTYTNFSSRAVYLHRTCGYGGEPQRELQRIDDSGSPIWLGVNVCITQPLRLPIEVLAGSTYIDEFTLHSTESPNANPPITMDQRTGTFRLEYFIQSENRVEGWSAVSLLPLHQRLSNSFRVLPP